MVRPLLDIFGLIVFIVGFCATVIGCFGASVLGPGAAVPFWGGVVLMVFGLAISRTASKKTCPHCSERVKYKAVKCKHCGSDLTPSPRSAAAAPFYK